MSKLQFGDWIESGYIRVFSYFGITMGSIVVIVLCNIFDPNIYIAMGTAFYYSYEMFFRERKIFYLMKDEEFHFLGLDIIIPKGTITDLRTSPFGNSLTKNRAQYYKHDFLFTCGHFYGLNMKQCNEVLNSKIERFVVKIFGKSRFCTSKNETMRYFIKRGYKTNWIETYINKHEKINSSIISSSLHD